MQTQDEAHRVANTPVVRKMLGIAVLCWALLLNAANAQDTSTNEATIEEIIVTAQKREQAAQSIPVSISAITGTALEAAGISDIEGIRDITAGLEIVGQNPGTLRIAMRGVTNLSGQIESTAAIGYYLDETPVSAFSQRMPEFSLWDAQRVEVLRGPQGTLFGEGSMGGTIRVISNKPDPSGFSGRAQAQYLSIKDGDTGALLRGLLNVPLSDTAAFRITASHEDTGGWVAVPDLGLTDTNDVEHTNVRAALGWTPSDDLTIDFSYIRQEIELGNIWGQTSPGVLDPQAQIPVAGPIGQLSHEESSYDIFNATVNYDFDRATLVSATSWFKQEHFTLDDLTPQMPLFFGVPGDSDSTLDTEVDLFSQELRLVSNGDNRIDWTFGGFFKKNDRSLLQTFYFDLPDFGLIDQSEGLQESSADSWALYGEVDFEFSDSWSGKIGGRYYSDDRSLTTTILVDSIIFGQVAGTVISGSGDDTHFSPDASLTWTGDNSLFYVRAANGFRSGGTNPNAAQAPDEIRNVFQPEELWSYELGLKNTLANGTVQLNAYLYLNDWKELQLGFVTSDGLYGFTENAGGAESTGGEVEFLWVPRAGLRWAVNVGVTDAKLTEDVYNVFDELIATKGNKIPLTPDLSFGTTLDFSWPLANGWEGVTHVAYSYRDETFSEPSNAEATKNDSYSNLNLRGGVQGEAWGVYAFVTNATDEADTTFKINPVTGTPLAYFSYVRPRTIGLEVRINF